MSSWFVLINDDGYGGVTRQSTIQSRHTPPTFFHHHHHHLSRVTHSLHYYWRGTKILISTAYSLLPLLQLASWASLPTTSPRTTPTSASTTPALCCSICILTCDRARLPALYSDFRSLRTLNPDGYNANISAWRDALSRLATHGLLSKHSTASSPFVAQIDTSLLRLLESRQFGQPLALGTAVQEAVGARQLVPLQQFLTAPGNIFAKGWGEVPWNVLGWTLRQLGVVDPARGEDKLPAGRYVMIENLETASRELNARMASKTSIFDRVFTTRQFEQVFVPDLVPGQTLTATDLEVLLKFLSRDKEMIEYDGHTIRIKGTPGDSGPITEQDATIASIKELTANLKHQIGLLEARIDELGESAKTALGRKNRVSALAALKSRKMAESSLSTRYATLNQLEEVASRIEQAADQVAIVRVMESSSGVLEGLNKAVGGTEKVDGVMDRLREQMADTDEVAAILAESGGQAVDEAEIDDELEALEKEEKDKEEAAKHTAEEAEARKKLDELPTVPDEELRQTTPTTETGIAGLSIEEKDKEAQSVPI